MSTSQPADVGCPAPGCAETASKAKVVVKVGIMGDGHVGKTTLMVKYIEDKFDEDYYDTLGTNFMEKTVELRNVSVTISVWDLGGAREFETLMPLLCDDAKAMIFAFDLSQKQSLISVKRWYKEARKLNKTFLPILVGTKFDLFPFQTETSQLDITKVARKYASKMRAALIYCSSLQSINIKKIFKIIIAKVFNLKPKIATAHDATKEAILEFYDGTDIVNRTIMPCIHGYLRIHIQPLIAQIVPVDLAPIIGIYYSYGAIPNAHKERIMLKGKRKKKKRSKDKEKEKNEKKKRKRKKERSGSIVDVH